MTRRQRRPPRSGTRQPPGPSHGSYSSPTAIPTPAPGPGGWRGRVRSAQPISHPRRALCSDVLRDVARTLLRLQTVRLPQKASRKSVVLLGGSSPFPEVYLEKKKKKSLHISKKFHYLGTFGVFIAIVGFVWNGLFGEEEACSYVALTARRQRGPAVTKSKGQSTSRYPMPLALLRASSIARQL